MSTSMDSPAYKEPRTLVLCFDGTSNQYDGDNTNVVKLFSLLSKDEHQLCYYQAGIGTYLDPGVFTPLFLWSAKLMDEAVAWYLDAHVMGGYKFIMQNYRPGDKICLFGFSRGAYTARALAGMLHKVGLLPRDNMEQVPFAYKMYSRVDDEGVRLSEGFKRTYCREVKIEFLGVWDTVASVGMVIGRTLPFTVSNTMIKTFRHALSLDEHRAKFRPTLYHRAAPTRAAAALDPEHSTPVLSSSSPKSPNSSTGPTSATETAPRTSEAGHGLLGGDLGKSISGRFGFSSFRRKDKKNRTRISSAPAMGNGSSAEHGVRPLTDGGSSTFSTSKDKGKSPTPSPREKPKELRQEISEGAEERDRKKGLRQTTLKTAHVNGERKLDGLVFNPDPPVTPAREEHPDLKLNTEGERNGQVTDVLEVWFAGCHCDVGGGVTEDSAETSLSDITLRWMVREIAASQCGISFDTMALQRNKIPTTTFPSVFRIASHCDSPETSPLLESPDLSHTKQTSQVETEEVVPCVEPAVVPKHVREETDCKCVPSAIAKGCGAKCRERARTLDRIDAMDPIHDELQSSRAWWLLEVMPMPYSWQDSNGVWHKKWSLHRGKGRSIPDAHPHFHTTVRERMKNKSLNYTPKATFKAGTPVYVD
ncbi:hypothetical protein BD410DRAFT_770672 [Rickenella mellea]|uniref:T6SS Phospholipase effector Tle1-like catalytic domain-containing protein n=1 Tax=Rickenella mellea TaxID=50990 RepID=A0A4Y7Q442_9AGAM|nr:hypothetical protein BD410DRAFT_770672 [Rickenella mellea]